MKHSLSTSLTFCMLALTSATVGAQPEVSGTPANGVVITQPAQPNVSPSQATPPPSPAAPVLPVSTQGNANPVPVIQSSQSSPGTTHLPAPTSSPVTPPTQTTATALAPSQPSPTVNAPQAAGTTPPSSPATTSVQAAGDPAAQVDPNKSADSPDNATTTPIEAAPEETSEKFAFILPRKGSRFDAVSQYALDGVLAANYATEKPAQILLIRPGTDNSIAEQLKKAAEAGAMAAIGPLEREAIEQIAVMDFLPLPVITLNQIALDTEIALTPEEIEQRQMELEARQMADQAARELNAGTQLHGPAQSPTDASAMPAQASAGGAAAQSSIASSQAVATFADTTQTAASQPNSKQSVPTSPHAITIHAPGGLVQPLALNPPPMTTLVPAGVATAGTALTPTSASEVTQVSQGVSIEGTSAALVQQPQAGIATPQTAALNTAASTTAAPQLPGQSDGIEVSIASDLKVPGLVLAEDVPAPAVRYEPRLFPRNLLMMGLSMETDAEYIAEIGLQALPRLTETGERPKVLVLDQNRPLQKKISAAFCKVLTERGFAPDRLTIDLKNLNRITQFFELVVEDDDPEIEPEEPIDQEADPVAWRQQQLRQRRISAEKRAQAAFAEPPYYAVFMALDASTASQIRPRLPIRTRVWGTSFLYPGNPLTNPSAKALTYDLKQVGFVESPFILNFDETKFEETYKVAAPNNLVGTRLFSLGADAYSIAKSIARGQVSGKIEGLTGSLTFDLETSPIVGRRGACAMISNGSIRILTPQELIDYHVIAPGTRYIPKSNEKASGNDADNVSEKPVE